MQLHGLVPLYLSTHYRYHSIYKDSNTIFSPHNSAFDFTFSNDDLLEKVKIGDLDEAHLGSLATSDYHAFI
jgi:glycogen synthase